MTSSASSCSCSSTVATPSTVCPVKALTSEASVTAAITWLTPVPSISDLILAVTSSGVPAIDSLSASFGEVSSMPLARSPAPKVAP